MTRRGRLALPRPVRGTLWVVALGGSVCVVAYLVALLVAVVAP